MSLRHISEEEKTPPEIGKCGNRVAEGYSQKMRGYYAKVSDVADRENAVFVINRSESVIWPSSVLPVSIIPP